MAFPVFILDDDDKFRTLLQIRLKAWKGDVEFTIAKNLAEGKKILDESSENFELAIFDHELPDGVGEELMDHPRLQDVAILSMSSHQAPELPGQVVKAGARHFLGKMQVSEPQFVHLIEGLIQRSHLEKELLEAKLHKSKMDTIKTLLGTLAHEINNPLGAVLGGTYLVSSAGKLDEQQAEAVRLIDESGKRIKHVLKQLCEAADLELVVKGDEEVFHVPGDAPWQGSENDQAKKDQSDKDQSEEDE